MMMYLLSTGTEHVLSNFHFMINFQAYVLDLRFFVDMVQCGKTPNPSPSREPKASQLTGSAAVTEWITQERRRKKAARWTFSRGGVPWVGFDGCMILDLT